MAIYIENKVEVGGTDFPNLLADIIRMFDGKAGGEFPDTQQTIVNIETCTPEGRIRSATVRFDNIHLID